MRERTIKIKTRVINRARMRERTTKIITRVIEQARMRERTIKIKTIVNIKTIDRARMRE